MMYPMDVIDLARQAGKLNKTGEGGGGSLSSWSMWTEHTVHIGEFALTCCATHRGRGPDSSGSENTYKLCVGGVRVSPDSMTGEDWESAFGSLRQMAEAERVRQQEAAKAAREEDRRARIAKSRAEEEARADRLAHDREVIEAALTKGESR